MTVDLMALPSKTIPADDHEPPTNGMQDGFKNGNKEENVRSLLEKKSRRTRFEKSQCVTHSSQNGHNGSKALPQKLGSEKIVLRPLPSRTGSANHHQSNACPTPNQVSICNERKSKESDNSLTGLDIEPNGMEFEEGGSMTPCLRLVIRPSATGRRSSRVRRSAVFLNDKGADADFGLNLQGGDSIHEARKKEIARSRWVKAIWYATEEAHRRRAEKKKALKNLAALESAEQRGSVIGLKSSNPELNGKDFQVTAGGNRAPKTKGDVSDRENGHLCNDARRFLSRLCNHAVLMLPALVSISLFYLLFVVDWCVIATEQTSAAQNAVIYYLMAICFVIFIADFMVSFHHKHGLQWNVHLLLEVIVILASLPDIIFLAIALNANAESNVGELVYTVRLWRSLEFCFRVGAKVSRALRVIHLFNHLNLVRSRLGLNAVHDDKGIVTAFDRAQEEGVELIESSERLERTSIGVVLENTVAQHHLLMVGALLVVGWASDSLLPNDRLAQAKSELQFLISAFSFCNVTNTCYSSLPDSFSKMVSMNGQKLLYLRLGGIEVFGNETLKDKYRQYPYPEVLIAEIPSNSSSFPSSSFPSVAHVLDREQVVRECWAHTMEAFVLIVSLSFITTSLSSLIRSQVISPLRRIVRTVLALEVDPLRPLHRKARRNSTARDVYEVTLIENALHKIAALMQLGFGEAGANIIQENMRLGEELQVSSDTAGKVVHAIYGFCDIRNFTDCTEVLQVDVVKLVNEVASIVHESVVKNLGAPNNNIGDAFLLVWKPKGSHTITEVAESALRSYVRIIIEISRCKKLERWAKKKQIQARMPGFQLKMGFGMHYGWAIEGAIGSSHKIDASYLSPHVNMASRLESATKQFGVYVLFSEDVHALLSPAIQDLCRKVDRVTLKGSVKPLKLYTYDVPRIKLRGGTLEDDVDLSSASIELHDFFNNIAPPSTDSGFRNLWAFAMDLYIGGPSGNTADWIAARRIAKDLLSQVPDDGPARTLLAVMDKLQQADGKAPEDWRGFRSLDDK